jgi:hypothetical protein
MRTVIQDRILQSVLKFRSVRHSLSNCLLNPREKWTAGHATVSFRSVQLGEAMGGGHSRLPTDERK